jgi:hypothetical protein
LDTVAMETPARCATAASVVRLAPAGIDFPEPSVGDLSTVAISSPSLGIESFEMFRHAR